MLPDMRKPLYVRSLSEEEQAALRQGLRSSNAFVLRRCQIVLASRAHQHAHQIADQLHCDDETVRRALKAFNPQGLAGLQPGSSRPHQTRDTFSPTSRARLAQIARQSPRTFGHETSVWTLELLAKTAFAQELTPRLVSDETIRVALKREGIAWRRAKHHITSPDLAYNQKTMPATA